MRVKGLQDRPYLCTDKKENKIFLKYREIQSGAVAKSYMRKGFLIYQEMRKYFPIYETAVSHIWLCNCSTLNFPIYEESLIFFFISVLTISRYCSFYFLPISQLHSHPTPLTPHPASIIWNIHRSLYWIFFFGGWVLPGQTALAFFSAIEGGRVHCKC